MVREETMGFKVFPPSKVDTEASNGVSGAGSSCAEHGLQMAGDPIGSKVVPPNAVLGAASSCAEPELQEGLPEDTEISERLNCTCCILSLGVIIG